jgi:hypothetical protein
MRLPSFAICYEEPGATGGAGGGAPAGPGSASPGASGTPATSAPAPATGAPASTGATGAPAAKQYTYTEDRTDWVPRQRFQEINGRFRETEALVQRYRSMLEAGTGVKVPGAPPEPQDPAITEARNLILEKLVPELKPLLKLSPEQVDKMIRVVTEFPQLAESFQNSTQSHWDARGGQAIDHILTSVAKDFGVEQLTPFQRQTVGNAFIGWLHAAGDERWARYAQNDNRLLDEFINEYRSGFFDPIRRIGQAPGAGTVRGNQRLPPAPRQGGTAGPGNNGARKPMTEDEVHDAAFRAWTASSGQ